MGIKKSTRIDGGVRIHTWTDTEIRFTAEVSKWVDGTWYGATDEKVSRRFDTYQRAVDWVMDEYRLAKSPFHSWEEAAAQMAGDQGYDWESLDDDVAKDFLDAARQGARFGAL